MGAHAVGGSHHHYQCMTCRAEWVQRDGNDPQGHRPGCPNAREGDAVVGHPMYGRRVTEADTVREAYWDDVTLTNAEYGRLVEEAHGADLARDTELENARPCTCTVACIPAGITEEQFCRERGRT